MPKAPAPTSDKKTSALAGFAAAAKKYLGKVERPEKLEPPRGSTGVRG